MGGRCWRYWFILIGASYVLQALRGTSEDADKAVDRRPAPGGLVVGVELVCHGACPLFPEGVMIYGVDGSMVSSPLLIYKDAARSAAQSIVHEGVL